MSIDAKWDSYNRAGLYSLQRGHWLKISGRRGRPPPIIFARIVRPMNALRLYHWQFSHRCYGRSATSENRSKIGDFAPTRSLLSTISGTRGRFPPIIFARLVRPMNALQLCRWQFSYKKNFVADFLQAKCDFTRKSAVLRFGTLFGGLRGNVRRSS